MGAATTVASSTTPGPRWLSREFDASWLSLARGEIVPGTKRRPSSFSTRGFLPTVRTPSARVARRQSHPGLGRSRRGCPLCVPGSVAAGLASGFGRQRHGCPPALPRLGTEAAVRACAYGRRGGRDGGDGESPKLGVRAISGMPAAKSDNEVKPNTLLERTVLQL